MNEQDFEDIEKAAIENIDGTVEIAYVKVGRTTACGIKNHEGIRIGWTRRRPDEPDTEKGKIIALIRAAQA